ncbi:MAG: PLP-dependent cysteine synthase family protein [Acidobacteria bacterium]|nr:PLP-dependent cysteine synthase family protein [Acidobacteriota bacterium]
MGGTPLVEIDLTQWGLQRVRLFAKLEGLNPGGSIKDRPVSRMVTRALAENRLAGGRRLLDSSSGNAGIAYAQFGAALGIPVTLVVPGNASRERLERIAAHGAELILTDPVEGYDHAVDTARCLAQDHPDRYWYCNQYSNEENWRAHYEGTGAEILQQVRAATGRVPDAFVAGVGTGGTLTGVGRRLRRARSGIHIAIAVPEIFPGIEGLKPLGQPGDFVPPILDSSLIDRRIEVTLDEAVGRCRDLARQGLFVGPSGGAYVHVALEVASEGRFETIVTILSDSGERYVTTGMWERSAHSAVELD